LHRVHTSVVKQTLLVKLDPAPDEAAALLQTLEAFNAACNSAWAFAQLRAFITYKALAAGVPVIFVDPRNTSRTCPSCGHVDKANRKSQTRFLCVSCGCAGGADHFAAVEIGRRGTVSCPMTSRPGS